MLQKLKDSKLYVKNGITFEHPVKYIESFIEITKAEEENITVKIQNAIENKELNNDSNIAYPRFSLEYKKNEVLFDTVKYQNTFGLILALDQQIPMIKIYSGMNVSSCLNMTIFNAEHIHSQNITDNFQKVINILEDYVKNENRKINEYADIHNSLNEKQLNNRDVNELLGYMLRNPNRLGTSPIVKAAKMFNDNKSLYYINGETSLYNIYNGLTAAIGESKDLLYRPDKTVSIINSFKNMALIE